MIVLAMWKRQMVSLRQIRIWIFLIPASVGAACFLQFTGFPAAFLMGPMLVAIVFAARGTKLSVARPLMLFSQGVIGVLVASALDLNILKVLGDNILSVLLVITTTVIFSTFAGWLLAKSKRLPGTTAAWGCAPGAASGMITLAEEFGADPRLVALMQFLRVSMVIVLATVISRLIFDVNASPKLEASSYFFELWQLPDFLFTLGAIIGGSSVARAFGVPSGGVFIPMVLAFGLQNFGLMKITLPTALLYTAFTLIGLWVGLKFDRETVFKAIRLLPTMLVGTISLILLCGISAAILVWLVGVDPLTAYLATTPGALEAVTIIAVSSNADVSFILSIQTARLLIVIMTGPMLAKMICRIT